MADYLFLTDEEKARIVAEFARNAPDPDRVRLDAEAEHFRLSLQAKMRGEEPPVFEAPDTTAQEAAKVALEAEAVAFPLPVDKLPVEEVPVEGVVEP